ncbi:hypothetical protein [Prevotella sp. E2-28]|uniref:hypothetical protein n=1 Tax=Prevotella sp. E2-28 TaxID=2913620 RepID=UPI001EDBF339|nr:hypothetical protein [Prevotella sp. E2-28]UKK54252.1 hypothetical protein L6465_03060 [Prevotella sp. E2-28]
MTKLLFSFLLLSLAVVKSYAGGIEDIRQALEQSSVSQIQEKVFVHTDNQCYFVGDTLWYKAYVVRADNLQPTDMSRILYVELLSPDGLVVERQNIIISPKGYTCGQFTLRDSLYSGYYELRAYTRWMLNFNVRHHRYRRDETWSFYNKQMAADYFRIWDGLYSRVFPIYSKPEEAGDYDVRSMYQRPKTRIPKQKKEDLIVTFYPEGGHLIQGVENRVAFEAVNQHGEAANLKGTLKADGMPDMEIKTEYMGRGSFVVTPSDKRLKAHFTFHDKEYSFSLPKAEKQGVAIMLDDNQLKINTSQLLPECEYGLSVLCRGKLKYFSSITSLTSITSTTSSTSITIPFDSLSSGVHDLTIFDSNGQILADRLFFVNRHENDGNLITADIESTHTYQPYEKIDIPVQLASTTEPTVFSLSILDTNTDEPTYNNGNIMTDLLLSSELKGFIAYPAYYFESDDEVHRRHLDQLMMVQGWRKYNWTELSDTSRVMRYEPETSMTIEGGVYKMLSLNEVEPDEILNWQDGVGLLGRKASEDYDPLDPFAESSESEDGGLLSSTDEIADPVDTWTETSTFEYGSIGNANDHVGVNHGNLRHEVLVEAEISVDGQFVGGIMKTENGGHFLFNVPPFYGDAFLNMKAYKENDSIKKNMASRKDRKVLDEDAFPDYYVKRDVFFPMYTHDYTYYEKHQPEYTEEMLIDTVSELSMENDVHQLQNVNVKGHRRGRRAIDWKKPAFVMDAYDLYNDITDRGLSFGKLDMRQFPVQVCKYLFGNMNRYVKFNVDGRIDGSTYYRNYSPVSEGASDAEKAGIFRANRTSQSLYNKLKLKRLQDIRVFTDFEPRTEDSTMVVSSLLADATVEMVTIPNDGVQPTFRDRHILFHGFNMAEDFYQPDYSNRPLDEKPADYRRTLYWNPNAVTDEQGRFTATFYNNGKETRIRMTAAGVTSDGRLLHSK